MILQGNSSRSYTCGKENVAGMLIPAEEFMDDAAEDSFGILSTPKHKHSQLRFLTWVAYSRKYSPNLDNIQRRTCPLIGCEQRFEDPEAMLRHVYQCPQLSKGLYRCFKCDKQERVGRYHTKDCHELHLAKDRFATLANSLRLAKRFFSPRTLKARHAKAPSPRDVPHPGMAELPFDPTVSHHKLDTNRFYDTPHDFISEMSASTPPAELDPMNDATEGPADFFPPPHNPAELSCGHDFVLLPQPQYNDRIHSGPTELSAGDVFIRLSHSPNNARSSQSWPTSPPSVTAAEEHHPRVSGTRRPVPGPQRGDSDRHQTRQYIEPPSYNRTSQLNEQVSPVSPVSPAGWNETHPGRFSVSSSESPASLIFDGSEASSASIPSTRNTSMSDFEPSNRAKEASIQHCSSFFEELGSTAFSEPESFESMQDLMNDLDYGTSTQQHNSSECIVSGSPTINPVYRSFAGNNQDQCGGHRDGFLQARKSLSTHANNSPQHRTTLRCAPSTLQGRRQYQCFACGYEPTGTEASKKSNFKRHQDSCQQPKRHECRHPHCGKRFSRSDNLRAHQRTKRHFQKILLELIASSPWSNTRSRSELSEGRLSDAHGDEMLFY